MADIYAIIGAICYLPWQLDLEFCLRANLYEWDQTP